MALAPRLVTGLRTATLAAMLLGATAPSLAEDPALCARLSAQLYDHVSDRPPSRHFERFAMAVEDQLRLIERTEADLQRMGCPSGSIIIYGSSEHSDCRRLAADLKRMHIDLRLFERKRDAHAGSSGTTARQRILAALHANGCDVPGGVRIRESLGVTGEDLLYGLDNPGGRYRTLCVRTCDGYYFPVSWAVPPMQFDGDAARCNAMCPGASVELYVHRVPDQDSEDMVSVTTQMPYTALPNAFAYRDREVGAIPQCSCDVAKPPALTRSSSDPDGSIVTLEPSGNGTPGTEPPEDTTLSETPEPPIRDLDPNRRVRVVGPLFLPDQSEAIDLQAPDRIEPR